MSEDIKNKKKSTSKSSKMMVDLSELDLSMFGDVEDESLELALARNLRILANPNERQIKMYTRLNPQLRVFLAQLRVRNRFSKDRYTMDFIRDFEAYGVSEDGQGRTELKEIFEKISTPGDIGKMERLGEMFGRKH